jgi:hypothetical protein
MFSAYTMKIARNMASLIPIKLAKTNKVPNVMTNGNKIKITKMTQFISKFKIWY